MTYTTISVPLFCGNNKALHMLGLWNYKS